MVNESRVRRWSADRRSEGGATTSERRPVRAVDRKPNYLKRLSSKALTAAEVLAHHDEPELWEGLLNHESPDIRLRTLQYLTDRRDGKARQAINVSGGLVHAHTAYRDPKLAALSQEELEVLDALTRKLALPAPPAASPDGPQNQIESNTAIEDAEVVPGPMSITSE